MTSYPNRRHAGRQRRLTADDRARKLAHMERTLDDDAWRAKASRLYPDPPPPKMGRRPSEDRKRLRGIAAAIRRVRGAFPR